MVGGLYYLSTDWRWRRGNDPDAEEKEHAGYPAPPVCSVNLYWNGHFMLLYFVGNLYWNGHLMLLYFVKNVCGHILRIMDWWIKSSGFVIFRTLVWQIRTWTYAYVLKYAAGLHLLAVKVFVSLTCKLAVAQ